MKIIEIISSVDRDSPRVASLQLTLSFCIEKKNIPTTYF